MYKVTSDYRIIPNVGVVKMWYFNGVPFTFDEIDDPSLELIEECEGKPTYTIEELYEASNYLIMELAHPLLFEIEDQIECEEELPF
jgi:hypothetical protein